MSPRLAASKVRARKKHDAAVEAAGPMQKRKKKGALAEVAETSDPPTKRLKKKHAVSEVAETSDLPTKKLKKKHAAAEAAETSDLRTEKRAKHAALEVAEMADPPIEMRKKKRTAAASEPSAGPQTEKRKKKHEPAERSTSPSAAKRKKRESAEGPADTRRAEPHPDPDNEDQTVLERTVFIDGLPYAWTQEDVRDLFAACGDVVSVRAPVWQDSGRLRGFAHITFGSRAARQKAFEYHGYRVMGDRHLKVLEAREVGVKQAAVSKPPPTWCKTLFLRNLPYEASEDEVAALFRDCGAIKSVRFATAGGHFNGFAYIDFKQHEALAAALKKKSVKCRGRLLTIDYDTGGARAGYHYRPEAYQAKSFKVKR